MKRHSFINYTCGFAGALTIVGLVAFQGVASASPDPNALINPGSGCNVVLGNVHRSNYFHGNVDSKASITCNAPQQLMQVNVKIYIVYAGVYSESVGSNSRTANNIGSTGDISAFYYCFETGTYTYYSVATYGIEDNGIWTYLSKTTSDQSLTC